LAAEDCLRSDWLALFHLLSCAGGNSFAQKTFQDIVALVYSIFFCCVFYLIGSGNQLDGHYSSMNGQAKTINLPNSNSPYHEHVNKSNKFLDSPTNRK